MIFKYSRGFFSSSFALQKLLDAHEEQDVDAYTNAVSLSRRI